MLPCAKHIWSNVPFLCRTMGSKFMDHNQELHWIKTAKSVNDHLHPTPPGLCPATQPDFKTHCLASCSPSMLIRDGPDRMDKMENRLSCFYFFCLANCPGLTQRRLQGAQTPSAQEENEKLAQCCQTSDHSLQINKDVYRYLPISFPADGVCVYDAMAGVCVFTHICTK